MLRFTLSTVAALSLIACSGEKDDTATTDTATTDTGSDTGTDTDTSDTTDTGVASTDFGTFAGTVAYDQDVDGTVVCDADIALTGASYTGDCGDCTFAFAIDAEVTTDNGTADCELPTTLTFMPDPSGVILDPGLFFWETFETDYGTYTNVAATGFSYYYAGYTYAGPYFAYFAYDGGANTFVKSGNDVSWNVSIVDEAATDLYLNDCGTAMENTASTSFTGTETMMEDVACDATTLDVWSFDVAAAGTVSFTVDTVAADSTFDAVAWINGADTCTMVFGDDNFDCAFPPANYSCPSWEGDLDAGSYQLIVTESSYDTTECVSGTTGAYSVTIGGAAAGLTLAMDDTSATSVPVVTTTTVVGAGTITPAAR